MNLIRVDAPITQVNIERKCGFTDRIIEINEPHLLLFKKIPVSVNEVSNIIDTFDNFENSQLEFEGRINCNVKSQDCFCDTCNSKPDECIIMSLPSNEHRLCSDCAEDIHAVLQINASKIIDKYVGWGFGFSVKELDRGARTIIDNEKVKGRDLIVIGKGRFEFRDCANFKLENIDEVIDCLKNTEDYDFTDSKRIGDCVICDDGGFGIRIDDTHLCFNCKDKVINDLENFRDENLDYIVSNSI
jgi:hypothetical protein